jgi:cation/acetate symporter
VIGGARASGVLFFLIFLALSLGITVWAVRRSRTADAYLLASRRIGPVRNGLALAGDFMAASSFLGVSGLAALNGFDGMVFTVATLMGWPLLLLLLAEPLRSLGRATPADVLALRLGTNRIKAISGPTTIIVVLAVLTFQLAGAGSVVRLLFGLRADVSVLLIGGFMLVYVLFGGMLATTWVQIVKCVLLVATSAALLLMVLSVFGFSPLAMLDAAAARGGPAVLAPGSSFRPLDLISILMGSTIGVASLPQVLQRFYTVPDARVARQSMMYATTIIGASLLMFCALGYGAMALVGPDAIRAADRGGNMAIPLLAEHFGGAPLLGFVAAITVATVLAAVCGIVLAGAATLSYDIWEGVVRRRPVSSREQMLVARLSAVALCGIGIVLAIAFEGQNIAFLSAVAATIAASSNFPALVLAIYWKRLTLAGAVSGMLAGLLGSLAIIWMSPLVQIGVLHHAAALFPLNGPAIVTVPLAFVVSVVVSLATHRGAEPERSALVAQEMARGWH